MTAGFIFGCTIAFLLVAAGLGIFACLLSGQISRAEEHRGGMPLPDREER